MTDKNKRMRRYTAAQYVTTGLLCVTVAALLALGLYALSIYVNERSELALREREAAASVRYANLGTGAGRGSSVASEEAPPIIKPSDGKPDIVAVDGEFVEEHGMLLPTIPGDTEIHSSSAILIERETQQVIFQKEPARSTYPASLTKLMTAVLGISLHSDMDSSVTITAEMLAGLLEANASMVGFAEGEEVLYIDLLHGLLLPSGADAANAVAITCAGSIDEFIVLMNEKAAELGMTGTTYTNVHGLHDVKMRTTASDVAKLFDYALNLDVFREIIGKSYYTTSPTNYHSDGITFYSTVFSMLPEDELPNGAEIMGGKTGTTTPAGQCLASYATLGEREFILVTLGAFGYTSEEHYNVDDAMELYGMIRVDE
jgi:D-alanyl-D-alanine carboxypeptidase (penicillin-binding protein 5/6)